MPAAEITWEKTRTAGKPNTPKVAISLEPDSAKNFGIFHRHEVLGSTTGVQFSGSVLQSPLTFPKNMINNNLLYI